MLLSSISYRCHQSKILQRFSHRISTLNPDWVFQKYEPNKICDSIINSDTAAKKFTHEGWNWSECETTGMIDCDVVAKYIFQITTNSSTLLVRSSCHLTLDIMLVKIDLKFHNNCFARVIRPSKHFICYMSVCKVPLDR